MKRFFWVLLGLIFLVALFLRFSQLAKIPVGFHTDEASLGYNAYSLLMTGKDEAGRAFPLYIDTFGDNRPTGYNYLAMLPIKFFGLSIFATRLPSALFGSMSVFAIAFLSFVLFKNKKIALLTGMLLAIAPWSVVLSRASDEAVVALFFILIGFAFLFLSLRSKRQLYIILGGLFLLISFFFYHTPRVFVPMLFLVFLGYFFWQFRTRLSRTHHTLMISVFCLLSVIAVYLVFLVSGGTGRFSQVNIFTFPETKLVMQEQIREDGSMHAPLITTRVFHNKLVNYPLTFVSNYLTYFTGDFLFIKGGLPIWYQVPSMGLLYLIELPFLLYGLFLLCKSDDPLSKLPLLWLLIAPVVSSITVDDVPNVNRVIVLFPIMEVIVGYGLYTFVTKFKKNTKLFISVGVTLLFIANLLYFQHQYIVHASTHRTWYRNNGFDQMVATLQESYAGSDRIIVTKSMGSMYPLILFYMKYDPALYQREGSSKDREYTGFGKFLFVPQDCPSITKDSRFPIGHNLIYINNGNCPDDKGKLVKKQVIINREDGTKAFKIVYD
ncbi:MAG: glycosyltransferase family 39 protein [Patescibacteria group bacterium]